MVKRFLQERAKGCTCPPDFPVCVCGKEPELRILTKKARATVRTRARRQPTSSIGPAPRRGESVTSYAETARAEPKRGRAERRARAEPRSRSRAAHARPRSTLGGMLWIAVVAVLLAGVVAVNVAVLRLNVRLDKASQAAPRAAGGRRPAPVRPLERGRERPDQPGRAVEARPRPGRSEHDALSQAEAVSPRTPNRRIRLLLLGFVLLFAVTLGRAAWLQVVKGADYQQLAVRQHRETVPIPAGRGTIFDRTGEPLAIGEQTTTVFADPKAIQNPPEGCRRGRQGVRSGAELPLPRHHEPQARLRLRRAQGGSRRGGQARAPEHRGARVLLRGEARLPAGRRRRAGRRVRRHRQPRARRARALARLEARRQGGQRDDRQGPVRPRRRRRQVAPGEPRQERDADDRPSDPGQRRVDPRRDRAASGTRRAARRSCSTRAPGRSWRWRTRRPSTRTGSGQ